MAYPLNKVTIKGFKSIRSLVDFELANLNVLIGGNGAGKSNFIDFFRMMRAMMELHLPDLPKASLKAYISDGGGSDDFLFNGPKRTKQIEVETHFGPYGYRFDLNPTKEETFLISTEVFSLNPHLTYLIDYNETPKLLQMKDDQSTSESGPEVAIHIYESISSWQIHHFHDTSKYAHMRRSETIDDNAYLRFDGSNIAPYLFYLKEDKPEVYQRIVDTIRLVAPFFADFILKPNHNEKVRLRWRQKGSDYPLKPHHLSDGTIRFICLTTALLQPNPPSTMIIDEPELGLHPYAIEILAELIQATSQKTQLIISTQSAPLVDYFDPENVIVVNRERGESIFRRLDRKELNHWLEDYTLGDLWRKNIVTGGPVNE